MGDLYRLNWWLSSDCTELLSADYFYTDDEGGFLWELLIDLLTLFSDEAFLLRSDYIWLRGLTAIGETIA